MLRALPPIAKIFLNSCSSKKLSRSTNRAKTATLVSDVDFDFFFLFSFFFFLFVTTKLPLHKQLFTVHVGWAVSSLFVRCWLLEQTSGISVLFYLFFFISKCNLIFFFAFLSSQTSHLRKWRDLHVVGV